jgi:hypothetical protein
MNGRLGMFGETNAIGPLIAQLRAHDVTKLCGPYYVAYRVDFFTDGAIDGAECQTRKLLRSGNVVYPAVRENTRYPELQEVVAAARYPAWAFVAGSADERRARSMLARAGYRRLIVPAYVLYYRR